MTNYGTAVDSLAKVKGEFLDFPYPPCPYCKADCDHDGDAFVCPECGAWWPTDLGHLTEAKRECVECGCDAEVIDDDRQPRCQSCAEKIRANLIDPTEPYQCRDCQRYGDAEPVTGIGVHRLAWGERRCGRHRQEAQARSRTEQIMAELRAKRGA